jgi:hypothetical protein
MRQEIVRQAPAPPDTPVRRAVLGLDRWLQHSLGVHEYTTDSRCLFRIQRARARANVALSDGTRIRAGEPLLNLHFWNEHVPAMGDQGATVAWARQVSRAIAISLNGLAEHLSARPDLGDIVALRADMRFGTADRSKQLARISARYGFAAALSGDGSGSGRLHDVGERALIFLLILATNPGSLRFNTFRRDHKVVYLSRATLERRYRLRGGASGDGAPGSC